MEFQVYEYDSNRSKVIISASDQYEGFILGQLFQLITDGDNSCKIVENPNEVLEIEFDAETIQNPDPPFQPPEATDE